MRNPAGLLSARLRRREQVRAIGYRTPPGGLAGYASGLFAAEDGEDGRQRPPGSLTPEARRRLEEELRKGIGRHAVRRPGGERSVTEAIAAVPGPDWSRMPVPAAQAEAQLAVSGPQPALRGFPGGALPAEDVPQSRLRGQHPYPQGPQPSFTAHPARHRLRDTQAYTPDFAEAGQRPRLYAPGNSAPPLEREVLMPLPEDAEILSPAIGDGLAAAWPGTGESGEKSLSAWHEMCAVRYPGRNMNATFGDYAGVLGKANEITGTHGTRRWPLQALPAADPRWSALAAEALDTARLFGDDDPEQAAAYRRLHGYVTAAPDCETAVRLAELAAEAGIITRQLPAAMRAQARDAA